MALAKTYAEDSLVDFIQQKTFPCLGAKTALAKDQINAHCYGDIQDCYSSSDLLLDLYEFIGNVDVKTDPYSSFVAIFEESQSLTEREFEGALWAKLQHLHELDSHFYPWDKSVSNDWDSKEFGFSLGGSAFFIIGMNPNHSRKSRQYDFPAIVFNLHAQFEKLRESDRFMTLREHIRKRDEKFSGSKNPMLDNFGDSSEAFQYSGRMIENNWECPFHYRNKHVTKN